MNIERVGKTTGRWPNYQLVVNGIDLGTVRRTVQAGGDRMSPDTRYDGWHIHGRVLNTQEAAEAALIERGQRFGHI